MDVGALRALVTSINCQVQGVDVTVTRPNEDPIETEGLWMTPETGLSPASLEGGRRDVIRVLVLQRSDVPTMPMKTEILAPETRGGTVLGWRVDSIDRLDTDQVRVTVVRARDLDP